jgi:hypothetical protein
VPHRPRQKNPSGPAPSNKISGSSWLDNQNIDCPNTNPYLIHENLAPGRILPKGIAVEEPSGVAVSGQPQYKDGIVIGVKGLSMANFGVVPATTNIVLHCSDHSADGYWI